MKLLVLKRLPFPYPEYLRVALQLMDEILKTSKMTQIMVRNTDMVFMRYWNTDMGRMRYWNMDMACMRN